MEGSIAFNNIHQQHIIDYYEQMDSSFQNWSGTEPYQLHYGYKDAPDQSHHQTLLNMNRILAETAVIQPGETVLDAGCGVGGSALWIANHIGAHVHGITLLAYQVSKAREFAATKSAPVEFSVQDYTNTAFPDNCFEVVWGLESVSHAVYKKSFLQEAYRILKPGGRLVMADLYLNRENLKPMEAHALKIILKGWVMPNMPTRSQIQEWMVESGFRQVNFRDITTNIRASACEIFRRGKEGYPEDILTKGKNIRQIEHVHACLFQYIALEMNVWSYNIFIGRKSA